MHLEDFHVLARWLKDKGRQFSESQNRVKITAFMHPKPPSPLSVHNISGLSEEQIWHECAKHYDPRLNGQIAKARAELTIETVRGIECVEGENLDVVSCPEDGNDLHCHIEVPEKVLQVLELSKETTYLRELSEKSSLCMRPRDLY